MDERGMLKYQDGDIVTASMEKVVTDREEVSALGKIACGEPALEEENLLFKTSLPTAVLEYQNKAVYGDKVILVNELICQGVLSHIIKER